MLGKLKHLISGKWALALVLAISAGSFLAGCGGGGEDSQPTADPAPSTTTDPTPAPSNETSTPSESTTDEAPDPEPEAEKPQTTGAAFNPPSSLTIPSFGTATAEENGAAIDASGANEGWVAAKAVNDVRLKFQVIKGEMSYNYDLPGDGTPIVCPVNMGSGSYTFRVMQNTTDSNYVEICSVQMDVSLASEFAPFLLPSVICDYSESSAAVKKAKELTANAANEADAVAAIYDWVCANISYDAAKAEDLSDKSGYLPNPDSTLSSGTGICFDYSALVGAMLRSVGIPCQVITGYVSPNDLYHAWNMVYIDGSWQAVGIDVRANTWSRVDSTFGASPSYKEYVGDGLNYTDRYTY